MGLPCFSWRFPVFFHVLRLLFDGVSCCAPWFLRCFQCVDLAEKAHSLRLRAALVLGGLERLGGRFEPRFPSFLHRFR